MVRTFKVFGVVAIAALALTAVVASAASAAAFKSEAESTSIKGTQTESAKFTAAGATITCTGGKFEGMATAKSQATLDTSLAYSGCSFLFFSTTVNAHKCQYRFHAGAGASTTGVVDVIAAGSEAEQNECKNNGITFEAAGCKVAIFPQTGLNGATYANNGKAGTEREVTVTPAVTGIKYTATGLCPETGTKTNGKYENGKASVTGATNTEFKTMVGVFYE